KDWPTAMRRGLPLLAGALERGLDPSRVVLLHEPAGPAADKKPGKSRAEIVEYRIDSAKVAVEAPSSGYLFMSDTFFPGWSATVDGREASILRAWLNFRAVPLAA